MDARIWTEWFTEEGLEAAYVCVRLPARLRMPTVTVCGRPVKRYWGESAGDDYRVERLYLERGPGEGRADFDQRASQAFARICAELSELRAEIAARNAWLANRPRLEVTFDLPDAAGDG